MEPKLIIGALSVLAACTLLLAYCLLTMSRRAGNETGTADLATVLKYLKEIVMPKLDELAAAITSLLAAQQTLTDGVTNLANVVATENTAIDAALAALGGSSTDPQVQALIDAVAGAQTKITDATTALSTTTTTVTAETDKVNAALQPPGGGGDGGDAGNGG